MRSLFLFIIKFYQLFISKRLHRKCLFKENCSNYVFRMTKENGFSAGIKALKFRINNCNPNYIITKDKDKMLLITNKYEVFEEDFINNDFLN